MSNSFEEQPRSLDRFELLAALTTASLAAALFILSNQKWLDPIIDVGRDLYVPGAIVDGTKLYRDLLYFYPPATPYLLAAWVSVAGRDLVSYALFGAILSLVCAASLYVTGRNCGSREAGIASAFLFVAWSFTGTSTWGCNFIFPYAHAVTIGVTSVVVALAAITRYLYVRRSSASLAIALVAISLAGWCKVEFALLSILFIAVLALAHRLSAATVVAYAAGNIATAGAVTWYFAAAGSGHHWLWDNTLPQALLTSAVAKRFYANVSGFEAWPLLLGRSAIGAIVVSAVVLMLRTVSSRGRGALAIGAAGAVVAAAILANAQLFFAAWSILLIVLAVYAWRERGSTPLLLLTVVALASIWRIFLRPEPQWYGFALSIPLFVLITHVLFVVLPARHIYSRSAARLWWIVLAVISLPQLSAQIETYGERVHRVETAQGIYFDSIAGRAKVVNELVEYLRDREARELVVIPEGLSINYFAAARTPLSFQTFTPVEADFPHVERAIVEQFRREEPERVVLVTRDMREFGYRGWGVDYHRDLAKFIRGAYIVERVFRAERFTAVLLTLKPTVRPDDRTMQKNAASSVQQSQQAR